MKPHHFLFFACLLMVSHHSRGQELFVNPIGEGADPWVIRDPRPGQSQYLWCFSEGNRGIALHATKDLTRYGEKKVVWKAPESGPYSREIWAPELHFLQGRWHIYLAASDGQNKNHLTYVLKSATDDPFSRYTLHGPLATGKGEDGKSPNVWAIDMTPLELNGKLYAVWSGWDEPLSDRQYTYIAEMESPIKLKTTRVLLCQNDDYLWERTEEKPGSRGLHEGPEVLKHRGKTFLTYSTGASWLPTYKLGLLEYLGGDPLDPASWKKHREPVFQSHGDTFGVGHSSFVRSPDGQEWWHVYHAKKSREPGWQRVVYLQAFHFNEAGIPQFGQPVQAGSKASKPSGTINPARSSPYRHSLRDEGGGALADFTYYGHHLFYRQGKEGVRLGTTPKKPVNPYRSGEKLILNDGDYEELEVTVTLEFRQSGRDGGILFRMTEPSVGYDAQKGYFAGLVPESQRVILGRTDGSRWQEIARAPYPLEASQSYQLSVQALGEDFTVSINGKPVLRAKDDSYRSGTVGLRVVDAEVLFTDLVIAPR